MIDKLYQFKIQSQYHNTYYSKKKMPSYFLPFLVALLIIHSSSIYTFKNITHQDKLQVTDLDLTQDGKTLGFSFSNEQKNAIVIMMLKDGVYQIQQDMYIGRQQIRDIQFSPDGKYLAVFTFQNKTNFAIYQLNSEMQYANPQRYNFTDKNASYQIDVSSDGNIMAIAGNSATVNILKLNKQTKKYQIKEPIVLNNTISAFGVSLSKNGEYIIIGGVNYYKNIYQACIYKFDGDKYNYVLKKSDYTDNFNSVAINQDGDIFAYATKGGLISNGNFSLNRLKVPRETTALQYMNEQQKFQVDGMQFTKDSTKIVVGLSSESINIYQIKGSSFKKAQQISIQRQRKITYGIKGIAITPDASIIATGLDSNILMYISCQEGCSECTSTQRCIACFGNYLLEGWNCKLCGEGFVIQDSKCLSCGPGCSKCKEVSNCETCLKGFYLDNSSCLKCPTGCNSCINPSTCKTCKDGYYLQDKLCKQQQQSGISGVWIFVLIFLSIVVVLVVFFIIKKKKNAKKLIDSFNEEHSYRSSQGGNQMVNQLGLNQSEVQRQRSDIKNHFLSDQKTSKPEKLDQEMIL